MKRYAIQRRSVAGGLIFAIIVGGIFFTAPMSDGTTASAADRLDAGTIKAGLEVSEQEDQGFIDMVVDLVSAGKLPRAIVNSAFSYAKRQETLKFQYFKGAVVVLARRQGIRL